MKYSGTIEVTTARNDLEIDMTLVVREIVREAVSEILDVVDVKVQLTASERG